MRFAILGFAQTGKTSLFRILCGPQAHPESYGAHVGVAQVPDPRLEALAALYQPKKVTFATLEFVDSPPLVNDPAKDAAVIGQVRGADAFIHVVRAFGETPEPGADVAGLETEFLLMDLDTVNKRSEKVERDLQKIRSSELELESSVLEKARAALAAETPLRALGLSREEEKALRGFMLLSAKPLLLVLNASEEQAPALAELPVRCGLSPWTEKPRVGLTEICGAVEAEMTELNPADVPEFLAGYGLKESGRERILQSAFRLLHVLTFFTVNENECRAWMAPQGSTTVEAAGIVHSDFARRFIKAEVVPWKELVDAGSIAGAREKGAVRLEGKQHEILDGDVVTIRHGA